jgi:uncharacterized protein YjdB
MMRQIRSVLPNLACLTIGLTAAVACTTATDPVPIASITLIPGLDSVEVGGTYDRWVVIVKDAKGETLTGRTLTWESNNTTVAAIDASTGVVTGIGSGEALITVHGGGKEASAAMRVLQPVLALVVTPDSFDLPMTTTRQIGVQLVGPNGIALTNRAIIWSSDNPSVAVVSTTGVVTPVSLGTTTITIRAALKQANVRVRVVGEPVRSVRILPVQSLHVLRIGQSRQLSAECLSGTGQVLPGRPIVWVSSSPIIATVTSSGLVTGVGLGTASIGAECDNTVSASVNVQVTPIPVTSVELNPSSVNLTAGQQTQLIVTARDSTGAVLSLVNRTVTFFSNNNPVALVNLIGVVQAINVGVAQITATVDGVTSPPAHINVVPPFAMHTTPPWATAVPSRPVGEFPDR